MEITISQAQNVLRTYEYLIKPKPDRPGAKEKNVKNTQNKPPNALDRVTISEQSRDRLKEDLQSKQERPFPTIDEA
ncbi:MAG: hypothetical protein ACE5GK_09190 [Nitrospiria bacterium]